MNDARAEILRRVANALQDSPPAGPVPRGYARRLPPATRLVDLFTERAADYRAVVSRVPSLGLSRAVATALALRRAALVAAPPGLPGEWLADTSVEVRADDPPLSYAELDAVDGVITGCALAIAETGTIVLDGGARQGRRALSLLPDYHLCVVAEDQIVGTLSQALAHLDPRRPQTWISGPSATSDIELQRVEGVHGPRSLEVLVVDPDR